MPAPKSSVLILPSDHFEPTDADRQRAAQEEALGMVSLHEKLLSQPTRPVEMAELQSDSIQEIVGRLYEVAEGQRAQRSGIKKRTLVGLAAPQIGEALQIVLIDTKVQVSRKVLHHPECFINPEIVWRSRETEEGREGCFSAGMVWGLVRRPVAVKVRALTPAGRVVERVFEGFTARIALHEIDHLSGIRFPERITSDKKRHWVHAEEIEQYVQHAHHLPRVCSRARWEAYKK